MNDDGYVDLRDYVRPQGDLITPAMRRRQEELDNYESPEELLKKKVVFVEDFMDDRKQYGIIRGRGGTFYFDRNDAPEGLPLIPAKFSYMYGGENTVSYRKMYINVDDGSSGSIHEGVRVFNSREEATATFRYLNQLGRDVQLEGEKIFIFENRLIIDHEIDRFMKTYNQRVSDINSDEKRERFKLKHEEVIDDDYFF